MKNRFGGAAVWPRIIMMWLVALFAHESGAQNVQIHYDFGRSIYSMEESDRQKVTITYETFKADKQTTSSTAPERAARPSSSTRQLQSNSTFNTKS